MTILLKVVSVIVAWIAGEAVEHGTAYRGIAVGCPCMTPEEASEMWDRVMAADEETF